MMWLPSGERILTIFCDRQTDGHAHRHLSTT